MGFIPREFLEEWVKKIHKVRNLNIMDSCGRKYWGQWDLGRRYTLGGVRVLEITLEGKIEGVRRRPAWITKIQGGTTSSCHIHSDSMPAPDTAK